MAKAKIKKTVTHVDLALSIEEAQFLCDVLAKISGDCKTSRRKYQEAISTSLYSAGLSFDCSDLEGKINCRG